MPSSDDSSSQLEYVVRCSDERVAISESRMGKRFDDKLEFEAARNSREYQAVVDKACQLGAGLPDSLAPPRRSEIRTTPTGPSLAKSDVSRDQQRAPSTRQHAAPSDSGTHASSGTGFFVTEAGHILTNHHVAAGCRSLTVVYSGHEFKGTLLASDSSLDLALLKIDAKPRSFGAFRSASQVKQGETVLAVGYPLKGLLASGPSVSVGMVNALAGIANDPTKLQVSVPLQPGNSGGPLVDSFGNIVGVVVAKLNAIKVAQLTGDIPQNVNFAIKSEIARAFLEANQVEVRPGNDKGSKDTIELAASVRSFVVPIECTK